MVLQLIHRKKGTAAGFTLVELLAVIAIMILILAAAGSALAPSNRAMDLSSTSMQIKGLLDQGRQYAIAHNQYVQVRFYEKENEPGYYTAIGLFAADSPYYSDGTAGNYDRTNGNYLRLTSITPILYLPPSMAIPALGVKGDASAFLGSEKSAGASSLYSDTDFTRITTKDATLKSKALGSANDNYNWVSFYYLPNGATDFQTIKGQPSDPTLTFFTLVTRKEFDRDSKLPANFTTFSMPSATGRALMLRP